MRAGGWASGWTGRWGARALFWASAGFPFLCLGLGCGAALTAGGASSYKEPGELKISLLEGKKEEGKKPVDEDNSSDEEDDSDPISRKKFKGPRSVSQKRRVSAPKASSKLQVRHSIDGGEGLLGLYLLSRPSFPL